MSARDYPISPDDWREEIGQALAYLKVNIHSKAAMRRLEQTLRAANVASRFVDISAFNERLKEIEGRIGDIFRTRKEGHASDLAAPFGVVDEVVEGEDLDSDAGEFTPETEADPS